VSVMDDDFLIESIAFRDQPMTRLTDPIAPSAGSGLPLGGVPIADDRSSANVIREGLSAKAVCPFCGSQNAIAANSTTNSQGPCPRCTMEDTAATRQATKARIGPWHVLQTRNPAAPGMRYATLLALVNKGQVTARSVVRGPTTHQLWRYAAHVKGLSREFGVCYSCAESVDKTASHCPHCDRAQEPVGNPDALLEAREAVTPSVMPGPHLAPSIVVNGSSESAPADPYSLATRQAVGGPLLSHAERLRTAADARPSEIRRRPDGRVLSAMELAAALQVAPPPPLPQGHPVRTLVITVAIVSVLASAIIGIARPDIRQQAQAWAQAKWTAVSQGVADFHIQKPPPADGSSSPPDMDTPPANPPMNPTVQAPIPDPTPQPVQVFPNPLSATVNSTPVPQQVAPPPPVPAIQISPGDGASNSNATPPPTPTPAPVVPTPPARASILPDRPVLVGAAPSTSEIWTLHSKGLEAEGRQDWAEAVHCYEQIEQAPKDQWPSDVKIRLAIAQRALGN
jgi:hypothetical protein